MEKTIHFELQEQVKKVTPSKEEVVKVPSWGKRILPPIIQPWLKVARMEPECRTLGETLKKKEHPAHKAWYNTTFDLYHSNARWYRNVWWSKREKMYKPRDPNKTIDLSCPEGWKPETP